jgi:hypothetical protein
MAGENPRRAARTTLLEEEGEVRYDGAAEREQNPELNVKPP